MRWIREHKVVAVLMLVLIVSFTLLGVTLRYGQPGGTGILSRLYTTIEGPMIKAGSGIRENLTGFFAYQELMEENERLKAENAELRDEVNRLTLSANELQDLQDLTAQMLSGKYCLTEKHRLRNDPVSQCLQRTMLL